MHAIQRRFWRLFSLIAVAALLVGCSAISPTATSTTSTSASVGTVKTITAVTSVTGSGSTLALQTVSVNWKTTGTVGAVNVKAGDKVKAGDVLMTIDPASATTAQLEAQAELSSSVKALNDLLNPTAIKVAEAQTAVADAQTALDELLKPTDTAVAAAQQAVAAAQSTLETAQKTLRNSKTVDVSYYQEQVTAAQNALTNAQQNATVTDIGSLPVQLRQAQSDLERATNVYNNAKDAFAKCPACETVWAYDRMTDWASAQNLYTDAVNKVNQIQIQIDQAQRSNTTTVATAEEALTTAARNLQAATTGPDALAVSVNQAAVNVAQATLTDTKQALADLLNPGATKVALAKAKLSDAQDTLNTLLNPDATDVVTAKARVAAAQDALAAYTLTAPMDGEVLVVNYQPGDTIATATTAVTLGNRDHLRVEVAVDESDIGKVKVGNPVTVTIDALSDMALPGSVSWINPTGTTSSGLVKYTVRVDTTATDAKVLLGMSATAMIVTNTKVGALAVPLAAVQYDTQGEYVNRVKSDGTLERVTVASGQIQNGQVLVEGQLAEGDQVSLVAASTTTTASSSAQGGGGLGSLTGAGGPPAGGPQP
jgi:HlyD family secretion protein